MVAILTHSSKPIRLRTGLKKFASPKNKKPSLKIQRGFSFKSQFKVLSLV